MITLLHQTDNWRKCVFTGLLVIGAISSHGQNNELEMSSGSVASPATGPSTSAITATLRQNTTGSTFDPYSPTTTVKLEITSNTRTSTSGTTTVTGLSFGGQQNTGGSAPVSHTVFDVHNLVGTPSSGSFTSNPNSTSAVGISVTDNYGFVCFSATRPLEDANASATATIRYSYGTMKLTFSRPVNDPVIQISGLGGMAGSRGFTTELDLTTSGVTLSKLSGSSELSISGGNSIRNVGASGVLSATCGTGAACGSIKAAGTGITTLTFDVYVRGDGNGTTWEGPGLYVGDRYVMGVSLRKPATLSGTIYDDANGGTINGAVTNASNTLFVNVVSGTGATATVIGSAQVASDGTYSIPGIWEGSYTMVLATSATATVAALPATTNGYVNTAEGETSVSTSGDGTPNGSFAITVLGTGLTNDRNTLDFAIEQRPFSGGGTNSAPNPGGTVRATVPSNTFTNTTLSNDPSPGALTGIRITAFPTGASSIEIGGTVYNAGVPADVTALLALIIAVDLSGNPVPVIKVDPTASGVTSVIIPFKARDAAGVESTNTGNAVMNFTTLALGGVIYNDVNGLSDNTVNGTGMAANSVTAVLVDASDKVIATQLVGAGGTYNFTGLDAGSYRVLISNNTSVPSVNTTSFTSVSYPSGYVSTGEFLGTGAGNDGTTGGTTADGRLAVTLTTANVTNANLGIEQLPTAGRGANSAINPGGTNSQNVPASTFTNGALSSDVSPGIVTSIVITGFPTNATSITINGTTYSTSAAFIAAFPNGANIPTDVNGNPATGQTISVDPAFNGAGAVQIPFVAVDDAGKRSATPGTATMNFTGLSLSGAVLNDANGLTDNTVNGTGMAASSLTVVLVDAANMVVATQSLGANGTYSFTDLSAGNYTVLLSNNASVPAVNTTSFTTVTYPAGYVSTGENIGLAAGNDATTGGTLADGKIAVSLTTANITNVLLGIEQIPVVNAYTAARRVNPGSNTAVTVPAAAFTGSDAEDAASLYANNLNGRTVRLTPGTNGDLYYNGVPVTSAQTITGFDPLKVSIDPTGTTPLVASAVSSTFSYAVADNAGIFSAAKTVTMPFDVVLSISGTVWDDANGDAIKVVAESGTDAGGLFAVLTDNAGNVIQSVPVTTATGIYTFTGGTNTETYKVVLSTTSPVVGSVLTTSSLPNPATGTWVNTGTNQPTAAVPTGVANTTNKTGTLTLTTPATGAVIGQNFGIEQRPFADAKAFTAPNAAFTKNTSVIIGTRPTYSINAASTALTGSAIKSLSGNDAEDCSGASSCTTSRTYQIQTIKTGNTRLFYNYPGTGVAEVTAGTIIPNFNPANLTIYGMQGQGFSAATSLGFTYSLVDAAGVASVPVTYSIQSANAPLPVTLSHFDGRNEQCRAVLNWQSATETPGVNYELQASEDGISFRSVLSVPGKNAATGAAYSFTVNMSGERTIYRLSMSDPDGKRTYSESITLTGTGCGTQQIEAVPNPVRDQVSVRGLQGSNVIRVISATGQHLADLQTSAAAQSIDMSAFPAGLYLIQVTNEAGQTTALTVHKY